MGEVRATLAQIDLHDTNDRERAASKFKTVQNEVNQLEYRDKFPLKHETLEFAIKHCLDALQYAANNDYLEANQALQRALLNQERFDNWNVDVG